jgi:hypothetical protein
MWLRIHGYFLMITGSLASLNDLLSYFFARGPFGASLYQQPLTIGPFEAHVLAAILGLVLLRRGDLRDRWWNLVAAAIALSLGIANLVWFEAFHVVGSVAFGVVITTIHFVFVAGQLWTWARHPSRMRR